MLYWIVRHRRHPVINNAQPLFVGISILGAILGDTTVLFLVGDITNPKCHGFASTLLIATTLTYGPIVLKSVCRPPARPARALSPTLPAVVSAALRLLRVPSTIPLAYPGARVLLCRRHLLRHPAHLAPLLSQVRVWLIFDNPTMKKRQLSSMRLLSYLGAYVFLEVLLAVTTAVSSSVHASYYNYRVSDVDTIVRVVCSDSDSVYPIPAYTLATVPILASLVVTFKTRNVADRYSENRGIVTALNALVFEGVTNVPLTYILGEDNRLMMFNFKSISILAVSLISIGAIVLPKIYVTRPAPNQHSRPHTDRPHAHPTYGTTTSRGGMGRPHAHLNTAHTSGAGGRGGRCAAVSVSLGSVAFWRPPTSPLPTSRPPTSPLPTWRQAVHLERQNSSVAPDVKATSPEMSSRSDNPLHLMATTDALEEEILQLRVQVHRAEPRPGARASQAREVERPTAINGVAGARKRARGWALTSMPRKRWVERAGGAAVAAKSGGTHYASQVQERDRIIQSFRYETSRCTSICGTNFAPNRRSPPRRPAYRGACAPRRVTPARAAPGAAPTGC